MLTRRFMRIFILAAALLAASVAHAGVVYTVVDDTYTSGSLGRVIVSPSGIPGPAAPRIVTNLGGDHSLHAFRDGAGDLRVLLSQYTYGQPDTVWIYDAKGGYRTPLKEAKWSGLVNCRGAASLGDALYVTGYDEAKVSGFNIGGNYAAAGSFTYNGTAGYNYHGQGIVRAGDHVFALFNEEKGTYPNFEYNGGRLVKLTADLQEAGRATVGKNPFSVKSHAGMIYVVSTGGAQNGGDFNRDSVIQRVNPNTMVAETLLRAGDQAATSVLDDTLEDSEWLYDFRDIAFAPNGDVYILAGAYSEDWSRFNAKIFKTTLQGLADGSIGTEYRDVSGPGFVWSIEYDAVDGILWCAAGNRLRAFDGTGSWEFDPEDLGGNFYSFTVVDAPANPTPGGGGGGGCNSAGFPAFLLTGLLPILGKASGRRR
ncbi:MAG: hypothetical protein QM441_02225 [Synergistota bacterium]|nr:hypothetical protein [Synergistota bacterium]OPZ36420.1 MAG: hypothetical protein BWY99_02035 [Synergistetes bacterium ADurb.BinA166]